MTGEVPRRRAPGSGSFGPFEDGASAIHANYWLSGLAGHALKHRLDLPLVSTFHTLDRVKAVVSPEETEEHEPDRRALAEASVIGCSDAVLASCQVEVDQLVDLYDADPARVWVVAPGVDHAFFSPGDQAQARRFRNRGGVDRINQDARRAAGVKPEAVGKKVAAAERQARRSHSGQRRLKRSRLGAGVNSVDVGPT